VTIGLGGTVIKLKAVQVSRSIIPPPKKKKSSRNVAMFQDVILYQQKNVNAHLAGQCTCNTNQTSALITPDFISPELLPFNSLGH